MRITSKITPCLWFDSEAEEAARFYVSLFENSRITRVTHYAKAGEEIHGRKPGSVMTVAFELAGTPFTALNGGPMFRFTEAVSFQVACDTQEEIDRYWTKMTGDGGEPSQCGWLKDRFGLSWQILPSGLDDYFADADPARAARVMDAMLKMTKFDLAALRRARDGK